MRTILVIDDEECICAVVRALLESSSCRVLACETGSDGVAIARQERPDLILLDYLIPGTNGIEVLKELRRYPETVAIPVMMISGWGADEALFRAVATSSSVAYLLKPFSRVELLARIEQMLNPAAADPAEAAIARLSAAFRPAA